MRMPDFTPLSRFTVGFDRLFDMLDQARRFEPQESFPPYDIERTGEDAWRVTIAVPGYTLEELDVESQPNLLVISGRKSENRAGEYLYRGLANRAFERRLNLADYVTVTGARLENGLLTVDLVRELPEAMRPRRIEIGTGAAGQPKAIENRQAA